MYIKCKSQTENHRIFKNNWDNQLDYKHWIKKLQLMVVHFKIIRHYEKYSKNPAEIDLSIDGWNY